MSKNTSILLGSHYEAFIGKEIAKGKYNSTSEVVRTALRLLEDETQKRDELRKALVIGEKSGFVENFDRKKHLAELHKRLK